MQAVAALAKGPAVKRAFLTLLCLAMLSLATAPAGFMPARASDGTLVLSICSASNPQAMTITVPLRAAEEHEQDETEGDGCDYGPATGFNQPKLFEFAALILSGPQQPAGLPGTLTGIFPASLPPSTGPPRA